MNKTLGNVFEFVAKTVGFRNTQTALKDEPDTRQYTVFPGPLNPALWHTFTAPPQYVSRFGGSTLVEKGLDKSITAKSVGKPINIPYAAVPVAGVGNIPYTPVNFNHHSWEPFWPWAEPSPPRWFRP